MSRRPAVLPSVLTALCCLGCASVEDQRAEKRELARIYLEEGKSLYDLGQHEESLEAFDNALETWPDPDGYAEAYFRRGNARFRLGRDAEAIADYTAALRADPGLERARFNRGESFRRLGRWKEALRDFQDYHQGNPSDVRALKRIGLMMYEHVPSKRYEALTFLRRYLELAGRDEDVERSVAELERELFLQEGK